MDDWCGRRPGQRIFTIVLILAVTQASAPADTPVPETSRSGRSYSWLRFADEPEDTGNLGVDSAPRVARQPQPPPAATPSPLESELPPSIASPEPTQPAICTCSPPCCDAKKCKALQAAVASAHKPLFFDNDFSYVLDPCYGAWWPGDHLKRLSFGDCWTMDLGGQYRARYHAERNHRGLGLTGRDDDFLLHRTRLFANVEMGDQLRFYAEMRDAVSEFENFPPRPIEEDRMDVLNFFLDGTLWQNDAGRLLGRVGRQELLYGSQRLVSPLDWSDTRRTFDGGKLFWRGADWAIDGFWTRPFTVDPTAFDKTNLNEQFYGLFSTYSGFQNDTVDIFWFGYENDSSAFHYQTIGLRDTSTYGDWLTEFEAGYQFGDNSDGSDHSAGYLTVGLGRKWSGAWKPTLWVYYDWASGTDDLAAGNGFNHLFPLAHKYLGYMDLFARSNIETPNVQFTVSPTERLTLLAWYYYFFLENKNDSPYNVNMSPFSTLTPASADLGHEIDLTASYSINARTNLLLGYSHFFSGDYYNTPGLPYSGDADFFYTQMTFDF